MGKSVPVSAVRLSARNLLVPHMHTKHIHGRTHLLTQKMMIAKPETQTGRRMSASVRRSGGSSS